MRNEILLIASLLFTYGAAVLVYRLFGKMGLYCFSAVATVLANLEVGILVRAFGLEQTLGNILFGATFLVTDILSECEGKKEAKKCVSIGLFSSVFFLAISSSWMLYAPESGEDMIALFSKTPRIIVSSLLVYAIVQFLDVWLYDRIWKFTEKRSGNRSRFLWLRNNLATLTSQFVNAVLFNLFAFYGIFEIKTLVSVMLSSFLLAVFTGLLDTPFLYLARRIGNGRIEKDQKEESPC